MPLTMGVLTKTVLESWLSVFMYVICSSTFSAGTDTQASMGNCVSIYCESFGTNAVRNHNCHNLFSLTQSCDPVLSELPAVWDKVT